MKINIRKKLKALKLKEQSFRDLCKEANIYSNEKIGVIELELVCKKYDSNKNKAYEDYTEDEWRLTFESDGELTEFEKRHFTFVKDYLIEDKRAYSICQELADGYNSINYIEDANVWLKEMAYLTPVEIK